MSVHANITGLLTLTACMDDMDRSTAAVCTLSLRELKTRNRLDCVFWMVCCTSESASFASPIASSWPPKDATALESAATAVLEGDELCSSSFLRDHMSRSWTPSMASFRHEAGTARPLAASCRTHNNKTPHEPPYQPCAQDSAVYQGC